MAVERTLSIIKPDAVAKNVIGRIYSRFEDNGLKIIAARMMQLSRQDAEGFYAVHRSRPFFKDLVDFMVSGPVIVQVLEGEGAKGDAANLTISGLQTSLDKEKTISSEALAKVELLRRLEELSGTLELRHCPAEGAQRLFEDVLSEVAGAIAFLRHVGLAVGGERDNRVGLGRRRLVECGDHVGVDRGGGDQGHRRALALERSLPEPGRIGDRSEVAVEDRDLLRPEFLHGVLTHAEHRAPGSPAELEAHG